MCSLPGKSDEGVALTPRRRGVAATHRHRTVSVRQHREQNLIRIQRPEQRGEARRVRGREEQRIGKTARRSGPTGSNLSEIWRRQEMFPSALVEKVANMGQLLRKCTVRCHSKKTSSARKSDVKESVN